MGDPLRDRQVLEALASKGQVIEITGEIGDFERLADSVGRDLDSLDDALRPSGWRSLPVRGRLEFGRAGAGDERATLSGRLETAVPAVCQRCLDVFSLPVASTVDLTFAPAGANLMDDGREPWELNDGWVRPIDVVDELLVMALPLAARHENDEDCAAPEGERAVRETTRPFANLKTQMGAKKTK